MTLPSYQVIWKVAELELEPGRGGLRHHALVLRAQRAAERVTGEDGEAGEGRPWKGDIQHPGCSQQFAAQGIRPTTAGQQGQQTEPSPGGQV